jgi:putative membrane protein
MELMEVCPQPLTGPDGVVRKVNEHATYDKLGRLSGRQFDREFARHMVQDHKKDIAEFERESKKSGEVANFAQDTLSVLKKHLQIAEQINGHQTTGSARH